MSAPDGSPLLLLDHVGEGRVAMLLSDQIWLWSRGHDGGGPQAELLRRVAHWLMKEPELEEQALTARVDQGKLIVERRSTDEHAGRHSDRHRTRWHDQQGDADQCAAGPCHRHAARQRPPACGRPPTAH